MTGTVTATDVRTAFGRRDTPLAGLSTAAPDLARACHAMAGRFARGGRLLASELRFGDEPLRLRTRLGDHEIDAPKPATVQLPLIQTIVDELTGHGVCPSTGASAIRTTRVIDAILADHRDLRGPPTR